MKIPDWDPDMSLDELPEPTLADLLEIEEHIDEDMDHLDDLDLLDIAISLDDVDENESYEDDYFT